MFVLWKIIIVLNVFGSLFVDCQFDNQFLGHHFTLDQYNNQELACETPICLRDAQRLLLAATQNETICPCDNFPEFALGQFIKLGALNDRYSYTGFINDVEQLDWAKNRKVLATRINENDIKPFKIVKQYYQKCVNSDNVRANGTSEILQYVNSLGGAPLLNFSWDEGSFNFENLFEKETETVVSQFLNHDIKLCPHPQNISRKIVCLKSFTSIILSDANIDDNVKMFKELKIEEQLVRSSCLQTNAFRKKQIDLSNEGDEEIPIILPILEVSNYTNTTLNWLKIFNSQLTIESELRNDSEVLIEKPKLILKLLELVKVTSKGDLADLFVRPFLYRLKRQFIVYPFDEFEKIDGTKKSKQRWEQCVFILKEIQNPALQALYATRYFNKEVQESAKSFIKEVVRDFIVEVKDLNFNDKAKQDIVEKLNTIQYVIGYPEEILNLQKIEEFYEDLELDGTEGIVKTYMKMHNYDLKKKMLKDFQGNIINYFIDENILYVPPRWIQYPCYHPERSRFFNTATLFDETANSLKEAIHKYVGQKWRSKIHISKTLISHKNYVKWEESGGKDLRLPGFLLTNRQVYWVVFAHKLYFKYHPHNNGERSPNVHFQYRYFHLFFRNLKYFQEAFNCSKLTDDEKQKFKTFRKELNVLRMMQLKNSE